MGMFKMVFKNDIAIFHTYRIHSGPCLIYMFICTLPLLLLLEFLLLLLLIVIVTMTFFLVVVLSPASIRLSLTPFLPLSLLTGPS